ncbi:MAG: chalcone isomerase family protein [Acidovorax sp.]|nr:chalcone isomerase family protein [Acidovorax sp.]
MHALFLAAGLCWGAAATAAVAVELAGVKVEDAVTVSGTKLQLNGAGIRYKGPFKVYVGDLYTTRRVSSLDDLIAAPGPKRLSMTFLRDINSAEFGKLLTRGMEDNVSKQELSKIIPGMIKMGDIFAANKSFAPGDVCSLEWDPAKGLSVYAKGKLQAEPFKDPAFYRALMSIWFGNTPADWKLKDELLGVKPQPQ